MSVKQRLRRPRRVTGPLGIPNPLSCRLSLICPKRECRGGVGGVLPRGLAPTLGGGSGAEAEARAGSEEEAQDGMG